MVGNCAGPDGSHPTKALDPGEMCGLPLRSALSVFCSNLTGRRPEGTPSARAAAGPHTHLTTYMFKTAEVGNKVSKQHYKQRAARLRQELLLAQRALRAAGIPCILLFKGVDAAGKSETVNRLNEWMDPRWITTRSYRERTEEEAERPRMWRYWRQLPPAGRIGIYTSAWYSRPFVLRAEGHADLSEGSLDEVLAFERALADGGALILKFWMHLSRKRQKARLEELQDEPTTAWRVGKREWDEFERYDEFISAAEEIISRTSSGEAPWHIIEGTDHRYRELRVGEILRDAIRERVEAAKAHGHRVAEVGPRESMTAANARGARVTVDESVLMAEPDEDRVEPVTLFSKLEMPVLERNEYKRQLREAQARLGILHRRARELQVPTVLVFEGPDAAGKGGAIRRVIGALDDRYSRVIPVAAPNDEERAQHYLWRFWRYLPRAGELTVFDRSWYGRVLVERVEGFAAPIEWQRSFGEINQFESELAEHNTVVLKFWVHISNEEQYSRFIERQNTPHKSWKLTDEDWRNRARWDEYSVAAHEMIGRTSTRRAPWVVIPGNDKKYARVTVINAVADALEAAIEKRERSGK